MMLAMIGKVTGHAQVQATQRYAHQPDDPLRIRPEQLCDVLRGPITVASWIQSR
jgi:hypothetical protein